MLPDRKKDTAPEGWAALERLEGQVSIGDPPEAAAPKARTRRSRTTSAGPGAMPDPAAGPVESPDRPDAGDGPPQHSPSAADSEPGTDPDPARDTDKGKGKKKKKKEKKKKEAVLIRFDRDQLALIDQRAESLSLNRAAWLRMTVALALAKG